MVAKNALHNLKSGLVLDHGVFVALSQHDLWSCIEDMRVHNNKPLCIVGDAQAYFTPQKLLELIQTDNEQYILVNEALGGFFTEQQIEALGGGNLVKKAIIGAAQKEGHQDEDVIVNLGGQKVNENQGYSFAHVPPGWTVTGNMSLGPTKIKRKVANNDGDGTLFFMGPKDFEKLWLFASKAWSSADAPISTKINTGLGFKTALLHDDKVELGGNYIRRYELEQVAKHRNWAMPANVKIAA